MFPKVFAQASCGVWALAVTIRIMPIKKVNRFFIVWVDFGEFIWVIIKHLLFS
jgi:hypothetical protein